MHPFPLALPGSPPRRRAFTLIELLVVVGIIVVLAAIALPVLSRVQAKSRETKCASNLRQMQTANLSYATQNDGWPIQASRQVNGAQVNWYNDPDFQTALSVPAQTELPDNLLCPLARADNVKTGYAYNTTGLLSTSQAISKGARRCMRLSQMSHPSTTLAFIDGCDWQANLAGSTLWTTGVDKSDSQSDCSYRHHECANVMFWDGHLEFLPKASIMNNTALWTMSN